MKTIKSNASKSRVREANHSAFVAIEKLSNVPCDTFENSIARLEWLIEQTQSHIKQLHTCREDIVAQRLEVELLRKELNS